MASESAQRIHDGAEPAEVSARRHVEQRGDPVEAYPDDGDGAATCTSTNDKALTVVDAATGRRSWLRHHFSVEVLIPRRFANSRTSIPGASNSSTTRAHR